MGGGANKMGNTIESTILGGFANNVEGQQNFVGGGGENTISSASASTTILGGYGNSINGEASTIVGGNGNSINGNYSVIVGGEGSSAGSNSFAGGVGVSVGNNSFGRGGSSYSIGNNFFGINVANGAVVNRDTPNAAARLTVNGDLRVQQNANDTNSCGSSTAGVIKTVKGTPLVGSTSQYCPCVCNGSNWESLFDTPQCLSACNDPRAAKKAACGTEYRTCTAGELLDYKSYFYRGDGNDGANTNNDWIWLCYEKESSHTITCKVTNACQPGDTTTNSQLCPYVGTTNSTKKSDRELSTNDIPKKLVADYINGCTSNPDDQSSKCQYYCKFGYTRRKLPTHGQNECLQNHCQGFVEGNGAGWDTNWVKSNIDSNAMPCSNADTFPLDPHLKSWVGLDSLSYAGASSQCTQGGCQRHCEYGYHKEGNSCVVNTCAPYNYVNAEKCVNSEAFPIDPHLKSWSYQGTSCGTSAAGNCSFRCYKNHHLSSNRCVADTQYVSCSGSPASNASWNGDGSTYLQTWVQTSGDSGYRSPSSKSAHLADS